VRTISRPTARVSEGVVPTEPSRVEYAVIDRSADHVVLQLRGELTGSIQTDRIAEALEEHYIDDGVKVIKLDVSGLEFLDSYGVATLMELMRQSERRGKRFVATGAERQVRDKLRMTGVLQVLEAGTTPGGPGA
jgi:anti-anti-sigma factor